MLRVQEIAQAFEHGGLAGSDLAREHDEALAALHTVDQVGQRFFVLQAPEQKARVRAHIERVLRETEESVVHTGREQDSTQSYHAARQTTCRPVLVLLAETRALRRRLRFLSPL